MNTIQTDVCVLGAGPGGVATALQLHELGISCVMVDKAVFPRDKICGDAISGKVVYALNRIDKSIVPEFVVRNEIKVDCWGVNFIFAKGREIKVPLKPDLSEELIKTQSPSGFVAKRMDFDNFMIDVARKRDLIKIIENCNISKIIKTENGFELTSKDGETHIKTKLLIGANGAHSKFMREFGNIHKDPAHYAGSVRGYYKNVTGFNQFNFIELHYLKEFLPGYLWVFPLPNGQANVGVGMRSDLIAKDKVKLKEEMIRLLKEHPRFKERFKNAELVGKLQGFGLPLGSKKRKLSGDHFMLIGDAASLIDPLTGEGIGNAMISGRFAAMQVQKCLETNNFSSEYMEAYDKMVYDKLWDELKVSYRLQKGLLKPWMVAFTTRVLANNKQFGEVLSAMFSDVDLRKKLQSPKFYFKLIFNRK